MRWFPLAVWALAGIGLATAPAPRALAKPAGQARVMRLSDDVSASHYAITITPDMGGLSFAGEAAIDVTLAKPLAEIEINAADLGFDAVRLDETAALGVSLDPARQTARLRFPAPIAKGAHRLLITYHGVIGKSAKGLFALDYPDAGASKRMIITQFEPADARRFVPCLDEPARKATFALSVIVPDNLTAVSNMPETGSAPAGPGLKRVTFATTPRMSTYLLFLGVGELERRSRMVDGVDVGVVTKRGDLDRADFALAAAAEILPFYNDYFGTPYPLPKLDLIAAPGSGGFGAMENWGAVLYFEHALLLDPRFSTERERQGVYSVIAHETAHQWFGNLVTMSWWDDLWLNEGFASWMQNKVADHFHPDWQVWDRSNESRVRAISLDAHKTSHPIVQAVPNAAQAVQSFDAITYQKSRSVIRMLESQMGADIFRDGVRRYMRRHAYGNTVTGDLWREMTAAGAQATDRVARDFTEQAGVPLVSLDQTVCARGATTARIKVQSFSLDPGPTGRTHWTVPVSAVVIDGAGRMGKPVTLLTRGEAGDGLETL